MRTAEELEVDNKEIAKSFDDAFSALREFTEIFNTLPADTQNMINEVFAASRKEIEASTVDPELKAQGLDE